MIKELINQTHTANIYGLYNPAGAPIGTMEVILCGPHAGSYYYSLSGKYTKAQIKKLFREAKEGTRS